MAIALSPMNPPTKFKIQIQLQVFNARLWQVLKEYPSTKNSEVSEWVLQKFIKVSLTIKYTQVENITRLETILQRSMVIFEGIKQKQACSQNIQICSLNTTWPFLSNINIQYKHHSSVNEHYFALYVSNHPTYGSDNCSTRLSSTNLAPFSKKFPTIW